MQRFRLMNLYLASLILVFIATITGTAWLTTAQGNATQTDADPRPTEIQPSSVNRPLPADASATSAREKSL